MSKIRHLFEKGRLILGTLRRIHLWEKRTEEQEDKIGVLQSQLKILKRKLRKINNEAIRVVFVCHNPSLWGKLRPLYDLLLMDPEFEPILVSVPYRHTNFPDNEFHDGGMSSELEKSGVTDYIEGYNHKTQKWYGLAKIDPDFVFFQTPYDNQFPYQYSSDYVSTFADLCYVPYYGILLYQGEVEAITHPKGFFKNVSLTFLSNEFERAEFLERFKNDVSDTSVFDAGAPMFDRRTCDDTSGKEGWNLSRDPNRVRILWTPRWRTSEGNCHFFDYKDYFLELARTQKEVDFLFRPHPLCLQNFISTGEMTKQEVDAMVAKFESLPNAGIDKSGDYQKIFASSDVLVSDMSSIIAEYFITGKPVVYTHRVDHFNSFGKRLSKGFYWVETQAELDSVLSDLRAGSDPLKEEREKIIKDLYNCDEGGASAFIRDKLRSYFIEKSY